MQNKQLLQELNHILDDYWYKNIGTIPTFFTLGSVQVTEFVLHLASRVLKTLCRELESQILNRENKWFL
jgi:hypothetical protein